MAPDPFEFLDPWFTALDGLLVVADRHRMDSDGMIALGRDPETDWWLRVSWQKAFTMLVGDREQGHRQLLRWREALLLVGAFAIVNNTVFVAKLCTLSGFLPAAFMELKTHALLPRIEVTATEQLCRLTQVYGVGLRDFCLLTDFSDEFMRDFTRLTALSSELVTMPRV